MSRSHLRARTGGFPLTMQAPYLRQAPSSSGLYAAKQRAEQPAPRSYSRGLAAATAPEPPPPRARDANGHGPSHSDRHGKRAPPPPAAAARPTRGVAAAARGGGARAAERRLDTSGSGTSDSLSASTIPNGAFLSHGRAGAGATARLGTAAAIRCALADARCAAHAERRPLHRCALRGPTALPRGGRVRIGARWRVARCRPDGPSALRRAVAAVRWRFPT